MAAVDYAGLLERARQGMPRDELAPYMPALVDVNDDFENPTRLRLLGNAIANNKPNASVLQGRPEAIERLLSLGSLGLQILYNGSVDNKEFAETLVHFPRFAEQLPLNPVAKSLVGAIFESMDNEVPQDFTASLAVNGFVELILNDPKLEQHPLVLQNFARVYKHCQQITMQASESLDPEEDFTSLGFRVVGNISSHSDFGLEKAEGVPEEPFTWDTVALLVNLTAAKANLEQVFAHWPRLVASAIELVKEEDPENVEVEEITVGPQSGDDANQGESEEEFDEEEFEEEGEVDGEGEEGPQEPPFDLGLWGPLFRNVARYPPAAKELAQHEPAKLVARLLESPMLQEVAWDFASMFGLNSYDHDLVALVTEPPHSGGTVLVASSIVQGMVGVADIRGDELKWAAPLLAKAITAGLAETDQPPVWIKGTRALAMLKVALPETEIDVSRVEKDAPEDEAVRNNIAALKDQ